MIFVARGVTHAHASDDQLSERVRDLLVRAGYRVRVGGAVEPGRTDQVTAEENIVAIETAEALVTIVPESSAPISSVWIELGGAIATGIPIIVVVREGGELPFLLRALAAEPERQIFIVAEGFVPTAISELMKLVLPTG